MHEPSTSGRFWISVYHCGFCVFRDEICFCFFFPADETADNTRAEGKSMFSLYFSKSLFRSLERRQGPTAPSPGHDPRARGPPERLRRPGDVRVPPRQPQAAAAEPRRTCHRERDRYPRHLVDIIDFGYSKGGLLVVLFSLTAPTSSFHFLDFLQNSANFSL